METLNFLLAVGLVEQEGISRRKATFSPKGKQNEPFPLALLSYLCAHTEERQRALQYVHKQLVQADIVVIDVPAVRRAMEQGPYGDWFVWTDEKIIFWSHLMHYIGLVRRLERTSDIYLIPQAALFLRALQHIAPAITQEPCDLHDCLHQVDQFYFACFTRWGRIHEGLGQTLVALHKQGTLSLTHHADAAHSHLLGHWRVSQIQLLGDEGVEI